MKLILISLIFSTFFMDGFLTGKPKMQDCKPTNDQSITLPGIFNHTPVTESSGDILLKSFENLKGWEKRKTDARELFENASFSPSSVNINNKILNLAAGFDKVTKEGCVVERGAQVTYAGRKFGPKDGFTYSAVMKPTNKAGVVSAFFVHLIDDNTNNPSFCNNNNEIDIEVVRYGSEAAPSLRGKLFAYFTSWQRALSPWGYKGNSCAADPAAWDQRRRESHGIQLHDRFTKEYHKYSFTWKENEIKFYIDDVFIVKHTKVIPQKESPLKLNAWAAQGWLGYSKNKPFNAVTKVKLISVSSKGIK